MIRPTVVLHGDWGTAPSKRWVATGVARDGVYEIGLPTPAGDLEHLLPRTVDAARGQVVAGFDFPIGVPAAWANEAGVATFLGVLPAFGSGEWVSFYDPATEAAEISTRRPFYPKRPGGTRRNHLWQGLGLRGWYELYRKCELATERRSSACPLFWILGGQQVGRAAIIGWRDVLAPAVRTFGQKLSVWPFSGHFASYESADCIIVETYPADACLQIGLCAPGRGWSKRRQDDRAVQAEQILRAAPQANVALSGELRRTISNGFGSGPDGEDAFDAVVGLIAMVQELTRPNPGKVPVNSDVEDREGWIFGQPAVAA